MAKQIPPKRTFPAPQTFAGWGQDVRFLEVPDIIERLRLGGRFDPDIPRVVVWNRRDAPVIAHEYQHYKQFRQGKDYAQGERDITRRTQTAAQLRTALQELRRQKIRPDLLPNDLTLTGKQIKTNEPLVRLIRYLLHPLERQSFRAGGYYEQYLKRAQQGPVHLPLKYVLDAFALSEGDPSALATVLTQYRKDKPHLKKRKK